MKRWMILLLTLAVVLCGCADSGGMVSPETTVPETTTPETITTTSPVPSLKEQLIPWDEGENLYRVPLKQLGLREWMDGAFWGERLLLWAVQSKEHETEAMELWLVDLESGETIAECRLPLKEYCVPQIQEDRICICDNGAGVVTVLDQELNRIAQWNTEPNWSLWFMGDGSTLYQTRDASKLVAVNLDTGEETVILDRINGLYASGLEPDRAALYYTDVDTMERHTAYLDFRTGAFLPPPLGGAYSACQNRGEKWLCRSDLDGRIYHFLDGQTVGEIELEGGLLHLTDQEQLLLQHTDGNSLFLYHADGSYVGGCALGEEWFVSCLLPTWNRTLDGFMMLVNHMTTAEQTLLLWRPDPGQTGEALVFTPVTPEEIVPDTLEELRIRAEAIGNEYGLKIWLGRECQTDFSDFTAAYFLDPILVSQQLDVLERALAGYPQGFFLQLRYSNYQQIHIQLVQELVAKPHYGTGGSYGAFVQPWNGYYLMVVNCDYAAEGTYYHEFSHIIDDYLEWDSWQREDALFSEDTWTSLNPEDFSYTWNYGVSQDFQDGWDKTFVDHYAMTNPTEDRARTLEYGMLGYMDWRFDEMPGVREKLRYYAACIRDGFDTTGWPEELLWEQYLD